MPQMSRGSDLTRLFVAVEIPAGIRDSLRSLPLPECFRPVPANGMHITLNFIGERDARTCLAIENELKNVSIGHVAVSLNGLGCFSRNGGSVAWAGIEASAELAMLKRMVDEAVARITGSPSENRPWRPHITLGRARKPDRQKIRDFLAKNVQGATGCFQAAEFVLFKSDLTPRGPVYSKLREYPLGR